MNIKNIRKQLGLSQKQLAEKVNIPIRTLQSWEQGYRTPPEYIIQMIEKITQDDSLVDQHGNNTNFSNAVLSDITVKGLLGKWAKDIYDDVKIALHEYCFKNDSYDIAINEAHLRFELASDKINILTPVLEDMVQDDIWGIEDIFISIYGVSSDEVYALRSFLQKDCKRKANAWDTDYMWNNCSGDRRLHKILTGHTLYDVEFEK